MPTETNDATYYNWPVRDHQPLSRSENQLNVKTSLLTGSGKTIKRPGARPGPTTLPKPTKRKFHHTGVYTINMPIFHLSNWLSYLIFLYGTKRLILNESK